MSVINFTITKPLEKKINSAIKKEGFTSKAEFFRFAVLNYINNSYRDVSEEEYEKAVKELKNSLIKKYKNKKPPSLEKQLEDIL